MASQVLNNFEVETVRASRLMDIYSGRELGSFARKAPAFAEETDDTPSESSADGLGAAKGFLVAVGLQVALGVSIFGLWRLWHTLVH
jgi:hypothetical protein